LIIKSITNASPKLFESKDTITLAKALLNTYLVHNSSEGTTIGKIIETEAYLFDDPASHTFSGKTKRNFHMFGPAGYAYIYQIYGIHFCFNVVSNLINVGEAVLIRALEPLDGINLMKKRRGVDNIKNLCNGPGKLVQAMGIKKNLNGISLLSSTIYLLPETEICKNIISTTRIGINKGSELEYRFYLEGNSNVSKFEKNKIEN